MVELNWIQLDLIELQYRRLIISAEESKMTAKHTKVRSSQLLSRERQTESTMRCYYHPPGRLQLIKRSSWQQPVLEKTWCKARSYSTGENVNWFGPFGKLLRITTKAERTCKWWHSNFIPRYVSTGNGSKIHQKTHPSKCAIRINLAQGKVWSLSSSWEVTSKALEGLDQ